MVVTAVEGDGEAHCRLDLEKPSFLQCRQGARIGSSRYSIPHFLFYISSSPHPNLMENGNPSLLTRTYSLPVSIVERLDSILAGSVPNCFSFLLFSGNKIAVIENLGATEVSLLFPFLNSC